MKNVITIILLVTIGIQTFSKWIVIFTYEINKDYIANNLCINKTKPSCCCKGKCFLGKSLAADDDRQQPSGKSAGQENSQVEIFCNRISRLDFSLPALTNQHNAFYLNGKSQEFVSSFFQPPQCS